MSISLAWWFQSRTLPLHEIDPRVVRRPDHVVIVAVILGIGAGAGPVDVDLRGVSAGAVGEHQRVVLRVIEIDETIIRGPRGCVCPVDQKIAGRAT